MNTVLLTMDNLSYTYPDAAEPALANISFTVGTGECLCLTGVSGCGKSTLLLAITGLLHGGMRSGEIRLAGGDSTDDTMPIGLVFQNADAQILCTTVAEEVAFGPENLCVPPLEIAGRVERSLRQVGLAGCADRNVERFSAGQKQRLAIASILAMEPALLLLDEPTSQLDLPGKEALAELLAGLKAKGHTLIIAEHDPRPLAAIIDQYLVMAKGQPISSSPTFTDLDAPASALPCRINVAAKMSAVATVEELFLSYPETGAALHGVNLRLLAGERVHLYGRNGAGKSTLLRCLAGLEQPDSGTVSLAGIGKPRPERLSGKVGVLFQNPVRQLFAESVAAEVAFTLQRLGYRPTEVDRLVAEALAVCGITHLAERAPLTLSFGEQHRVALAAVMAPRPGLLLLDEPFAGLDWPQRLSLLAILAALPERYGTTVLIASHDGLPDSQWPDRTLQLAGGKLVERGA